MTSQRTNRESLFSFADQDYVPQLNDDVVLTLTLPATTEEWADDTLREAGLNLKVYRDEAGNLVIRQTIGGNCNALVSAQNFVDEIADALRECEVDPMVFHFTAQALPRG